MALYTVGAFWLFSSPLCRTDMTLLVMLCSLKGRRTNAASSEICVPRASYCCIPEVVYNVLPGTVGTSSFCVPGRRAVAIHIDNMWPRSFCLSIVRRRNSTILRCISSVHVGTLGVLGVVEQKERTNNDDNNSKRVSCFCFPLFCISLVPGSWPVPQVPVDNVGIAVM